MGVGSLDQLGDRMLAEDKGLLGMLEGIS